MTPMLCRPLNLWPELLLGPMLRHVDPRSVCVFVGLKCSADIELRLYENDRAAWTETALAVGMRRTLMLGQNLHVALIEARIANDLVPGKVYSYNIMITQVGANAGKTLAEMGLLSDPYLLGYEPGVLPTFALPPGLEHLHLVHGSCRKTNGEGPDMFSTLDALIEASREQPLERPHQLFLTGDQIYADDNAVAFTRMLTEVTKHLIGGGIPSLDEQIPALANNSFWTCVSPELEAGPARDEFIEKHTGFRTTARDGHLIFLGEFYAMYLMVWSDALWPRRSDPSPPQATLWDPELPDLEDFDTRRWDLKRRKRFHTNRVRTLELANDLRRVRRALANVPTYMLFDDHEVTDDWNLNAAIRKATLESPRGRRIIRNALIAYAVFQDWGNRPGEYSAEDIPPEEAIPPGAQLFSRIDADGSHASAVLSLAGDAETEELLDLVWNPRQPPPPRMIWDWAFQGPEHQVVALDTRTWRSFPPGDPEGSAQIIPEDSLRRQLSDRLKSGPASNPKPSELDPEKLTFVISPPPILGLPLIETVQSILAIHDVYEFDNEPWLGNRESFDNMIYRLAEDLGRVIILSGDVHYAFTHSLEWVREQSPAKTARIIQFCSGALRNETWKTRWGSSRAGFVNQLGFFVLQGWIGRLPEGLRAPVAHDIEQVRGTVRNQIDVAAEVLRNGLEVHTPFGQEVQLLPLKLSIQETIASKLLFVSHTLDNNPALAEMRRILNEPREGSRFRLCFIADDAINQRTLTLGRYRGTPSFHPDDMWLNSPSHLVVGFNNIAGIRFQSSSTSPAGRIGQSGAVLQRHYWTWRSSKDPLGMKDPVALMFTEHEVPLTLPAFDEF
jgi:hypothetical protein